MVPLSVNLDDRKLPKSLAVKQGFWNIFEEVEEIIGHKVGDKFDVNVKFPENYGAKDLITVDANGVGHMLGHWEESSRIFLRHLDLFNFNEQEVELVNNLILYHDLRFNVDNMPFFEYKFGDNMYLLISHKKADIMAQNPKYIKRLATLFFLLDISLCS